MRRPRTAVLLVLFSLLLLAPSVARACSCAVLPNPRPCATFWGAPVVFVGLVTEFESVAPRAEGRYEFSRQRVARLNVEESFRGIAAATAEVFTGAGGGDCGYAFKVGERYVVHAWAGEDGRLTTGICSQTKPLERAAAELDYARGLAKSPPDATVYGSVVFNTRDLTTGQSAREPLAGARVFVESATGELRRETKTDAEGKYEVTGLPPGTYTARVSTPRYAGTRGESKPFKLEEKKCHPTDFWLTWEGEIGGRLTDERGEPVKNTSVYLVPVGADLKKAEIYMNAMRAFAGDDGRYKFEWVPPGRYLIVFNPTGEPRSDEPPYPRTFHPGTEDPALAQVVVVGENEKVADQDIRLSRRLGEREFSGTVVWPDGRPAAKGTSVFLYSASEVWRHIGSAGQINPDGTFTIKGWEGGTFLVTATVNMEGGRQMCAGPVEVSLRGEVVPVRLVVRTPYGNCLANYKRDPLRR